MVMIEAIARINKDLVFMMIRFDSIVRPSLK
jgi:hypothetical protein